MKVAMTMTTVVAVAVITRVFVGGHRPNASLGIRVAIVSASLVVFVCLVVSFFLVDTIGAELREVVLRCKTE